MTNDKVPGSPSPRFPDNRISSVRKFLFISLTVCLLAEAGCATVQKKFTRKKKEPAHIPSVIYFSAEGGSASGGQEGPYQKKYSNAYYYKTHFTMWKSWQDELLLGWGGNNKKWARSAQEAYSHLTEMNRYLVPAKQSQLRPQLDSLSQIMRKIDSGSYAKSEEGGLRTELEKIKRLVAADFYYDKVKGSVLADDVDLGSDTQS